MHYWRCERFFVFFAKILKRVVRAIVGWFFEPSALNSSYWKLRALHRTPALSGLPLPKRRERSLRSKLKQPSDLLQSCSQDCAERNQRPSFEPGAARSTKKQQLK